ncbi:hypothetical protein [Micromonospora coerulea]
MVPSRVSAVLPWPVASTRLASPTKAAIHWSGRLTALVMRSTVVNPRRQYDRAVEAFGRNGFIVLADHRQVDDLDGQVALRTGTEITFLRLVPLVGG